MHSKTVTFRMPQKEANLLDRLVAISDMTKQGYIISKLSDTTVKVVADIHVRHDLCHGLPAAQHTRWVVEADQRVSIAKVASQMLSPVPTWLPA